MYAKSFIVTPFSFIRMSNPLPMSMNFFFVVCNIAFISFLYSVKKDWSLAMSVRRCSFALKNSLVRFLPNSLISVLIFQDFPSSIFSSINCIIQFINVLSWSNVSIIASTASLITMLSCKEIRILLPSPSSLTILRSTLWKKASMV